MKKKIFLAIFLIVSMVVPAFSMETKVKNDSDFDAYLVFNQGTIQTKFFVKSKSEKSFEYEIKDKNNISYDFIWVEKSTWRQISKDPIIEISTSTPGTIDSIQLGIEITKKERSFVSSLLKKTYAGYSDMKELGFNIKMLDNCKTTADLFKLFDRYIHDYHFQFTIKNSVWRYTPIIDEKCIESSDDSNTYFEKATSNAYYIRFNSCKIDKENLYSTEFVKAADKAIEYDFIVLDARSNRGGGNIPQRDFFENLSQKKYKGTVLVLQDKYSVSSGEVWCIAGRYTSSLNIKLVGTLSGGMQTYGNCVEKKSGECYAWVPTTKMKLPNDGKWKGEGIGYEPDVFSYTENMKETLENLGVDTSDILFK